MKKFVSLAYISDCIALVELKQYQSVFSAHDGDLGCTNLLSHDIPLIDDTPARQRY